MSISWWTGGNIEIKTGTGLKGLDTYETQKQLQEVHGKDVSIACIGAAGENLVPMAAVINDNGRAAGRMGFGAVFGSKNLKAIVAAGKDEIQVGDKESLRAMARELTARYQKSMQLSNQFGTLGYLDIGYYFGDVPVKYFTRGLFPIDRLNRPFARKIFPVYRGGNAEDRRAEAEPFEHFERSSRGGR